MLQGRQRRREGFKGSLGRREGFKGSLVCLTSLSETRRKSPRKRPAGGPSTCCLAAKGAHAAGPPRAPGRVYGQPRAPGGF